MTAAQEMAIRHAIVRVANTSNWVSADDYIVHSSEWIDAAVETIKGVVTGEQSAAAVQAAGPGGGA